MRITYVLYGEARAPVVRAQTLPLLAGLRERGHEVGLVAITSPRRRLDPGPWRASLDSAREIVEGRLDVFSHGPKHRGMGITARRLRRRLARRRPDVVHARQSRAALLAARAGNAPVLLDARGVRPEEYLLGLGRSEAELGRKEREELGRLRAWDREALESAALVVCVSEPYRRHLGGGGRVRVIPNATVPAPAGTDRGKARADLGLSDDAFAFVYSGSLAPWQCASEAAALFAAVRERRPSARLVFLTHDPEGAARIASAAGIGDAVVRRLAVEEVRAALPAFDAALLLRGPSLVNEVSCPVKLAEYLHAGLPLVVTDGIGDASGWVRDHRLGVVLPATADPGNADLVLAGIGDVDREACRRFATERLSFDVTVPLYEEAYAAAVEAGP